MSVAFSKIYNFMGSIKSLAFGRRKMFHIKISYIQSSENWWCGAPVLYMVDWFNHTVAWQYAVWQIVNRAYCKILSGCKSIHIMMSVGYVRYNVYLDLKIIRLLKYIAIKARKGLINENSVWGNNALTRRLDELPSHFVHLKTIMFFTDRARHLDIKTGIRRCPSPVHIHLIGTDSGRSW